MSHKKEIIKKILSAKSETLPMMPNNCMKILEMINSDSSTKDLEKIVSLDAALSSQIVRIANSAVFGGRLQVTSIKDAIGRLGRKNLKLIVFSFSIKTSFVKGKQYKEQIQSLLKEGLKNAFFCRFLGQKMGLNPEELFLIGLIHNIGKVFLLSKLEQQGYTEDEFIFDLEEIYVMSGKKLLKEWQFPNIIILCHNLQNSTDLKGIKAPVKKYVRLLQISRGLINDTMEWEILESIENKLLAKIKKLSGVFKRIQQEEESFVQKAQNYLENEINNIVESAF